MALHRAAYLLYTHRFPLERQGVLVIGPNPLFLRYIERVLPSLGESGVTLSTISGLVHGFSIRGDDAPAVARLKGDARMGRVVARAVRGRQRPIKRTVEVPFGAAILHVTPEVTSEAVSSARRRPGTHNSRRRFVEQLLIRRLAEEYERTREGLFDRRGLGDSGAADDDWLDADETETEAENPDGEFDLADFGRQVRRVPAFGEALDRIWPRLSAEELLHDLFGAPPLLAAAAKGLLSPAEQRLLHRKRSSSLAEVPFTAADAALVDEARVALGARNNRRSSSEMGQARSTGRREPPRRRHGPTGTSSSTRPRICRRCSCGWSRAGHCRVR